MPDLTSESTPPSAAIPPIIDPAHHEDFPVFREVFLLWVTDPEANQAFRAFGNLLHDLVLEYVRMWPVPEEDWTALQFRAVVADLRFLQGELAEIAESLEGKVEPIGKHAGKVSGRLRGLADRIEAALEEEK